DRAAVLVGDGQLHAGNAGLSGLLEAVVVEVLPHEVADRDALDVAEVERGVGVLVPGQVGGFGRSGRRVGRRCAFTGQGGRVVGQRRLRVVDVDGVMLAGRQNRQVGED